MARPEIIGSIVSGSARLRVIYTHVVRLLINLLIRLKVTGLEHVPTSGPVVVVINHIAFLDPIMVITSLPRQIIPLAKHEAFESKLFGWMLRSGGGIPVHRGEADMGAVKLALRVLKQEGVVMLAPEGTRSTTHQLQPGKDGAALLAVRTGAVVLPVAVTGTELITAHWKRLRRPPVTLTVGPAFQLQPASKRPSRDEMRQLTTAVMYKIAALLPPAYRGVYSDVDAYLAEETHTELILPVG